MCQSTVYVIGKASSQHRLLLVKFWGNQRYTWIFNGARSVPLTPALFKGQPYFDCLLVFVSLLQSPTGLHMPHKHLHSVVSGAASGANAKIGDGRCCY